MRLGMRLRLSPTADVQSHTSGAANCGSDHHLVGARVRSPGFGKCHPGDRWLVVGYYGVGAGIGRMLDTFHASAVLVRTRFIKNRVGCGCCPGAPIVKTIGT